MLTLAYPYGFSMAQADLVNGLRDRSGGGRELIFLEKDGNTAFEVYIFSKEVSHLPR